MAATVSFCCLVILTLLSAAVVALQRLRLSPDHPFCDVRRRRSRWIGAFVVLRATYSLLFTFTGAIATCQLAVGDRWVNYTGVEDLVAATLTATTNPLVRRVAELERSGGLPELEEANNTLQELHSEVHIACTCSTIQEQETQLLLTNSRSYLLIYSFKRKPAFDAFLF